MFQSNLYYGVSDVQVFCVCPNIPSICEHSFTLLFHYYVAAKFESYITACVLLLLRVVFTSFMIVVN